LLGLYGTQVAVLVRTLDNFFQFGWRGTGFHFRSSFILVITDDADFRLLLDCSRTFDHLHNRVLIIYTDIQL
jgi:hypothetical protein